MSCAPSREEMRARLIDVCSRTGGHIGAGLGVVELTVALHAVFDTPARPDRVGRRPPGLSAQAAHRPQRADGDAAPGGRPLRLPQAHRERVRHLRRRPRRHGDLGRLRHGRRRATSTARDFKVVAILGDGALTCGLAYEGLNNAGASERDIIVVLNDNEMSIAPNVGAMSKYLTSIQRNPLYNRVRSAIGSSCRRRARTARRRRARSSGSGRRA